MKETEETIIKCNYIAIMKRQNSLLKNHNVDLEVVLHSVNRILLVLIMVVMAVDLYVRLNIVIYAKDQDALKGLILLINNLVRL